jgi:hypothetical protein
VLSVARRIRVIRRRDRVLAPDPAVATVGQPLAATEVLEDLRRALIGLALRIVARARRSG